MHITDILARHKLSCSFEFFPPKTKAGSSKLFETVRQLETLKPSFVSMTYGAGGSTRDLTHELVVRLRKETTLEPIPHLTCVSHTEGEIGAVLQKYHDAEIGNILALGGDPPRDQPHYDRAGDRFQHASDLVEYIQQFNRAHQRGFGVGVAGFPEGHPGTPNRLKEMDFLKAKVDAGADYVVTQLFFDNRDFYDFRERCVLAGIQVPILAGIMPVTSVVGMSRMADLALGARFPAALQRAVGRAQKDPSLVEQVGVQWATEQCRDLIDNEVRGLHFYTLNRSDATRQIYRNLGVTDSAGLQR